MKKIAVFLALASIAAALPPVGTCVTGTIVVTCQSSVLTNDNCTFCYAYSCVRNDKNTWEVCSTFCQSPYQECNGPQVSTVTTGQACYLSNLCPYNLPYAIETDTNQYDFCFNKYCGPSGAQITCNASCPPGITKNFSTSPIKQASWRNKLRGGKNGFTVGNSSATKRTN